MADVFSLKVDGDKYLTANFRVREFRCLDGSDKILIAIGMVTILQKIRDHFGKSVTINSGFRTESHNKKVGGSPNSQHLLGMAADIVVAGVTPLAVAQYAEYLMPQTGGIGVYGSFTHIDIRAARTRWDQRSGSAISVAGFPGYVPPPSLVDGYKATIQRYCQFSDPTGVWAVMDKHKYADAMYQKWADSYGGKV